MTGRRRELADSFRLPATDERWVATDLLLGVVALAVWVAGTGALVAQTASVAGYRVPIAPGGTWTPASLAALVVLWVVVPTLVAVKRLRSRVLNIRGNVEQYYRFDHPSTLLAPPLLSILAAVVAATALRTVAWPLLVVAVPTSLYVLVRTLAYGYRVYAVSRPAVLQAALALSLAVQIGSVLAYVGIAGGYRELVTGAIATAGLPGRFLEPASVAGIAVHPLPGLAVATPLALALAYLAVQAAGALLVRAREPDLDRSSMRSGQRYPPFLDSTPATTVTTASQSSAADGGDSRTADDPTPTMDATASDDGDDDVEGLDDVSNTRVFIPPDGGGSGGFPGADDVTPGSDRPADGDVTGGTGSGATGAPDASERRCEACGETFAGDATVDFCPNCGTAVDG